MKLKNIIYILLAVIIMPSVLFGADARDVMRRAESADKRLNYRGIKITTVNFESGSVTSKLKVVHLRPNLTRTEYYTPSALAGIVVIQNGLDFWKFIPRNKSWEHLCPRVILSDDSYGHGFLTNFNLQIVGSEHVAGRPTYVVQAVPKRGIEYSHRVWVDKEHYFIIRTEAETPNGRILNSSKYLKIDLNPQAISRSNFKVSGKVISQSKVKNVGFKISKPKYLPSGYKLMGITCMRLNGRSCVHLQYSNGVNSISLFEHKFDCYKPSPPIKSRITNIYSWTRRNISYTIMSDLSHLELQKIARSTR